MARVGARVLGRVMATVREAVPELSGARLVSVASDVAEVVMRLAAAGVSAGRLRGLVEGGELSQSEITARAFAAVENILVKGEPVPPVMLERTAREVEEVVVAGPWEEVMFVAAEVKRGGGMVVSDDEIFRKRLRMVLGEEGGVLLNTAAGVLWLRVLDYLASPERVNWLEVRGILRGGSAALEGWREMARAAEMRVWVERLVGFMDAQTGWRDVAGADEIKKVLQACGEMEGRWEDGVVAAVLKRALSMEVGDGGVCSVEEAEGRTFARVIVPQVVTGKWGGKGFGGWLEGRLVGILGLGNEASALEGLLHGAGEVLVTRYSHSGGSVVAAHGALRGLKVRTRTVKVEQREAARRALGIWVPTGSVYPKMWSASFVETMMACPYKAVAERVLNMRELDPLEPVPDARTGGLLVHKWLELAGRDIKHVAADEVDTVRARLEILAGEVLEEEDAVTQAIWRPKLRRLSVALAERWATDGREVVEIEKWVEKEVGTVRVGAKIDRVEADGDARVVIDFKTGEPPAWSKVESGEKPQLALEAWLRGEVTDLEYWKLVGYGTAPLRVKGKKVEKYVEPVADGVTRLVGAFEEGAPFPALPDREGGGLLATGYCTHCALSGVCRRKEAVE